MHFSRDDVIDGKYRIVRLLGQGGMGSVYEAVHLRIQRRVALKVMNANIARTDATVRRFHREAQAAGRIGSQHVVDVFDLGDLPGGDHYLVMEYLEGRSLEARLAEEERVSERELRDIALQITSGLAAAHTAGVIHRDLKPDNVFLVPASNGATWVKILDFGISRFTSPTDDPSMTRTGAVLGTPHYMSPEQATGKKQIDARSDLYSLGVILFEALCGRLPFEADSVNELLFKIALEDAPPLLELAPTVNPALARVVQKAMARDPDQRHRDAGELHAELTASLPTETTEARDAATPPTASSQQEATLSRRTPSRHPDAHSTTLDAHIQPAPSRSSSNASRPPETQRPRDASGRKSSLSFGSGLFFAALLGVALAHLSSHTRNEVSRRAATRRPLLPRLAALTPSLAAPNASPEARDVARDTRVNSPSLASSATSRAPAATSTRATAPLVSSSPTVTAAPDVASPDVASPDVATAVAAPALAAPDVAAALPADSVTETLPLSTTGSGRKIRATF